MYACSLSLHMASARSHASSRADQRVSPPLPRVGHGHGGWRWRWNALVWGQSQWGLSWLAPYHQFLQVFFKLDSIVLAVMDAMGLIAGYSNPNKLRTEVRDGSLEESE